MSFRIHHIYILFDPFYLKKAIVSVINDLVTDQRVHKACVALQKSGFDVLLVGRVLPSGPPMPSRPYTVHRMKLAFSKGPLFYAEYNLRLFFLLMFTRHNLLVSNDLDTLLPNFIMSRIRRSYLVYDSHEYFTETPELVHRPTVQLVWKRIEEAILPRLDSLITVNESIAQLFRAKYHIKTEVVRNIPPSYFDNEHFDRAWAGLPDDKKVLVLQGSGINIQRGAEEMVSAMEHLPDCLLLIIGGGDVVDELKKMVDDLKLEGRVLFKNRMPYQEMMRYTVLADLGLTLDKDTNINYRFSLPNKLFDYIHAGIPVLASPLPEIKNVVEAYDIGSFISNHNPASIAETIKGIFADSALYSRWKANLRLAAQDLCWEKEEEKLLRIYEKYR